MLGLGFGVTFRPSASGVLWVPEDEANCTLWAEQGDYAESGGDGTWTALVGEDLVNGSTAPTATDGEPVFNGIDNRLRSATALDALMSATAGTICVAVKPTAHPAEAGGPYDQNLFVSNTANSTFGLSLASDAGTDRYYAHIYDGSYKVVKVAATYNTFRSVVTRWAQGATIDLMVDGLDNNGAAGFSSTAIGTWGSTGGAFDMGGNYFNNHWFQGTVRAIAIFSTKLDDATIAKWNALARSRYGTA